MANYRAVSSGVWSALARWQDDGSGSYVASTVLPGAADVVYANNFTVTLDIDVVVSQLRTTTATNVNAGGSFTYGAGNSVTANVFAGTTTCLTHSGSGTKTLIGNATGGVSASACGIINSSTGIINFIGNANGGSGQISDGVNNNSSGTINLTGNCTGGSAQSSSGARNSSSGTFNINGTCTGNSAPDTYGLWNAGSGTCTITIAIASSNNHGVLNQQTTGTVILTEIQDASNGRQAVAGFLKFNNTAILRHRGILQNGTIKELVDNSVTNYPAQSNVRNLVQYGPGNIYTGTLVPDITPQDIFTAIANSSDPIAVRLRNVATVQTTGDQIAAAL